MKILTDIRRRLLKPLQGQQRGRKDSSWDQVAAALKAKGFDNKLVVDLVKAARDTSRKDIQKWKAAWEAAAHPQRPRRYALYNIYDEVKIDGHLIGARQQRELALLARRITVIDADGNIDEVATAMLRRSWFRDYLKLAFEARLYGHSLIQIDDLCERDGRIEIASVSLVSRAHVRPETGEVVSRTTDERGHDYREGEIAAWCFEVGGTHDLGLLLGLCPALLSKKNVLAFWDEFAELFGMPIRIARTTSRDKTQKDEMEEDLRKMGAAGYAVFSEGTDIELKETAKSDSYMVYDQRIERAEKEVSKAILGQTMTLENGSSRSQSEVHERMLDRIIDADADDLINHLRDVVLPKLIHLGYPLADREVKWDDAVELTLEEQREIDDWLLERFEVDDSYLETLSRRYNAPLVAVRSSVQPSPLTPQPTASKKKAYPVAELYRHAACCGNNVVALSQEEEEELQRIHDTLTKSVYDGDVPAGSIPADLYNGLAEILLGGIDEGYQRGDIDYDSPDVAMMVNLHRNIFAFSGAKSLVQLQEMRDLLTDDDGVLKEFEDYKREVQQVHDTYNVNYLRTEYNNAVASSQMASTWLDLQDGKEDFPNLEYSTVGDDAVRQSHAAMDGVVRPIDDEFWSVNYPPNGWNCRCDTVPTANSATDADRASRLAEDAVIEAYFKRNVGIEQAAFYDDHLYFESLPGELTAVKTYGLPKTSTIYQDSGKLGQAADRLKSMEQFEQWMAEQRERHTEREAGGYAQRDTVGHWVSVPALLGETQRTRELLSRLDDILTEADEIYSATKGVRKYVRYYQDTMHVVTTTLGDEHLVTDIEEVTTDRDAQRTGILIHRK